jgi:hypothetical protein
LKPREALFDRPQGPAIFCGQELDGLARFVEGTDVAKLDGAPVSFLDPPQGQALGSADVRALGVDSTCALRIEEGAGPLGVRNPHGEKAGVATANGLGLHVEDREPIDAARAAAPPALEARAMQDVQPARFPVHFGVQRGDGGVRSWSFYRMQRFPRGVYAGPGHQARGTPGRQEDSSSARNAWNGRCI